MRVKQNPGGMIHDPGVHLKLRRLPVQETGTTSMAGDEPARGNPAAPGRTRIVFLGTLYLSGQHHDHQRQGHTVKAELAGASLKRRIHSSLSRRTGAG